MDKAQLIDEGFDWLASGIHTVAALNDRWFLRMALYAATRTTANKADDRVVELLARMADIFANNQGVIDAGLDWIKQRAKGLFSSTSELPPELLPFVDDFEAVAELTATNWAEAA